MDVVAPIPRGLSLRAASLILALSLVAQLTYMDHVVAALASSPAAEEHISHTHTADDEEATASDHSLHCHEGLASCSEMPLAAGPGQVLFGFELLIGGPTSDFTMVVVSDARTPASVALIPPEQPPQSVFAVNI